MTNWISHNWPYVLLGFVCLGLAIAGMRVILGPLDSDTEEGVPTSVSPEPRQEVVQSVGQDAWSGFDDAHHRNPPEWPQNDSWHEEFIPR